MHSKYLLLLTVLLAISLPSLLARRELALRNIRKVGSTTMQEQGCLRVGNNKNCLQMQTDSVKIGWQTDQVYSTSGTHKYWHIRYRPYVKVDIVIQNELTIDQVFYNSLKVDVDSFMTNVFGEAYVYDDGTICMNAGWQVEDVILTVVTANKFYNCYKTIVQSLGDWSQWTKRSAGFLDECDQSDSEDVTLYTWNPITQDQKTLWFGVDTYPVAPITCKPGKLFFAGQYVFDQISKRYPEKIAEYEAAQNLNNSQ